MIVVDAAVVVDALVGADDLADLRGYLSREDLHAPALLDYEMVSALRAMTLTRRLSAARAEDAVTDFADLPIRRWSAADALLRRAFQLRNSLSAYDAVYVALAEALECPLVTRDARLARSRGHAARIEVR